MVLESNPDESFTTARAGNAENPEALQGLHGEHMVFFFDEASGIPDIVYDVSRSAMSTPGATTVFTSNPTRTTGEFYKSHLEDNDDKWHKITVSCLDSSLVDPSYVTDIANDHGEESNYYRVRVLGKFPKDEDDVLIPRNWVQDAIDRDVDVFPHAPIIWGVDVARFGNDKSALAKRKGNHLIEPVKSWQNKDNMQFADLIANEYRNTNDNERPVEILIDVIGVGAGVVDRLNQLNYPVRGINVSESPGSKDKFPRLRDELWWMAREWFQAKDCKITKDSQLIAELTTPKFDYDASGKLKVESKASMKKRGKKSPDIADAFCLTFASNGIALFENVYGKEINQEWIV